VRRAREAEVDGIVTTGSQHGIARARSGVLQARPEKAEPDQAMTQPSDKIDVSEPARAPEQDAGERGDGGRDREVAPDGEEAPSLEPPDGEEAEEEEPADGEEAPFFEEEEPPDGEEEDVFLNEGEGEWEEEPPDGEESWPEPEDEPE
jgi:hypothetical protein